MWLCYGIITVGTSGVTKQSAAFDPHAEVGPVLLKLKAKRLQLRRDTLTETRAVAPLKHLVINLSATRYDIDITYFPSTVSVILDWYVPLQRTLV